jgi:lipopolysaccharide export system permease protein
MVLQRYVLREHAVPFLFSFSVIMFLLVVDLILQKIDLILGKGIAPAVVTELFLLNTAWMVALAVPMAVLVSTLMAFGRLSGDNEVTAMRALGVGTRDLVWPVVAAALLVGGLLVLFNDRVLPEFNYRARLLMSDIQRKRPAVTLEEGVFIEDFENYKILIGSIDRRTSQLRDVMIYKHQPGGYASTIVAERGEINVLEERDEAVLTLYRGQIHRVDEADPEVYVRARFDKQSLRLGEAGERLSRTVSHYRTDRELSMGAMLDRVSETVAEAQAVREETAHRISDFFLRYFFEDPPDAARMVAIELRGLQSQIEADAALESHKRRTASRYMVEIHKKISIAVACLTFVLVGAPLGIRVRRSSPAVGAGISVGFFLVWWLFLIGGETLADRGYVPAWLAMWSPNIVVAAVGIWLCVTTVFEFRLKGPGPCGS